MFLNCYAYQVFRWWQATYPDAKFTYINAGIGATTSQFGVARVESDLLQYEPDVVFLEFSVNDSNRAFFQETFEGIVRRILSAKSAPALFMFNNVQYDDGVNAQEVHNAIGRYYDLPIVSMKESIFEEIRAGRISAQEITPDNLHPNDKGHRMVADVICHLLEKIKRNIEETDALKEGVEAPYIMPEKTITPNRFEQSVRYQNGIHLPLPAEGVQMSMSGFAADERVQEYGVADVFKNGWSAMEKGSFFEIAVEASYISVQFRKTIRKPAPVARAVVDGNEKNAVILDANFDETWGDCCYLQSIAQGLPSGRHTLRITIEEKPEQPGNDFYLISVITA